MMPAIQVIGSLAGRTMMMYAYIVMRRTQIYLTEAESDILGRESKRTGLTKSQLIREAIGARYLTSAHAETLESALTATSGAWAGRMTRKETGIAYVERLRTGKRLAGLQARRRRA